MCLEITMLKWDSAVLCHKSSHTVERLGLIIVEGKSDYNLFTKSSAKNEACLLHYTSHAAESVTKLIYEYNDMTVNDLSDHMWYVDLIEMRALMINLRLLKVFKDAWENWVCAVVVTESDKMILMNRLHDGHNLYIETCLLFVSYLLFYLLVLLMSIDNKIDKWWTVYETSVFFLIVCCVSA